MRIIHGKNYSLDERKKYTHLIVQNIVESLVRLVDAMRSLFYLDFENKLNNQYFDEFIVNLQTNLKTNTLLAKTDWYSNLSRYMQIMTSIWKDVSIQYCFDKRNLFYLNDSTAL